MAPQGPSDTSGASAENLEKTSTSNENIVETTEEASSKDNTTSKSTTVKVKTSECDYNGKRSHNSKYIPRYVLNKFFF